jgi:hypothetical protein
MLLSLVLRGVAGLSASSHPVARAFLLKPIGSLIKPVTIKATSWSSCHERSRITLDASVTRGSQRLKYNLSLAAPLTIELPRMLHRGTIAATIERQMQRVFCPRLNFVIEFKR